MNKTVLITGASSGIGEGCARKFASQGARLILNARSTDKLNALALGYAAVGVGEVAHNPRGLAVDVLQNALGKGDGRHAAASMHEMLSK